MFFDATVDAWAKQLAAGPPTAMTLTKRLLPVVVEAEEVLVPVCHGVTLASLLGLDAQLMVLASAR